MEITDIQSIEDLKQATQEHEQMLLLKHSLTCPISASANQAYQRFSEHSDMPLYRLYVQDAKELSAYIEENYQLKHESPQVIKFDNVKTSWNASHYDITTESLKQHS